MEKHIKMKMFSNYFQLNERIFCSYFIIIKRSWMSSKCHCIITFSLSLSVDSLLCIQSVLWVLLTKIHDINLWTCTISTQWERSVQLILKSHLNYINEKQKHLFQIESEKKTMEWGIEGWSVVSFLKYERNWGCENRWVPGIFKR